MDIIVKKFSVKESKTMKHIYIKGKNNRVFFLFHGTGGNEHDLISIAQMIDPDAHLIGVRGNVSEHGMNRFFKRLAEGVFDEEDLINRTHELKAFMDDTKTMYVLNNHKVIGLGYSNGANILGSLLFHYRDVINHAILFHPMVPLKSIELPDLSNHHIFIGAATNDQLVYLSETEKLKNMFVNAHADVLLHLTQAGHRLTIEEIKASKDWYRHKVI